MKRGFGIHGEFYLVNDYQIQKVPIAGTSRWAYIIPQVRRVQKNSELSTPHKKYKYNNKINTHLQIIKTNYLKIQNYLQVKNSKYMYIYSHSILYTHKELLNSQIPKWVEGGFFLKH